MTGSDSILSDQDWTRTEKFHSPLISARGGHHHWGAPVSIPGGKVGLLRHCQEQKQ